MSSVLRRYTPPTCTLDVMAKESPLSRWSDRPIVNRLRFRLQFDDPRLPADQQVTVEGDRTALEALSAVVDEYVQQHLLEAYNALPLGAGRTSDSHLPLPPPLHPPAAPSPVGLFLQSSDALSHSLHLGNLATDASGTTVKLSTLQLFDLATALDECTSDMNMLATRPRPAWLNPSTGWLRGAAVMVLAVGTTLSVVKLIDPTLQTATAPQTQTATSEDQQYSGVTALPDMAESEMRAPTVDPEALESIPPPPRPERSPANPRADQLPQVTVPSQAPVPPITTTEATPPPSPIPSTDLPPAVILPSPTLDSEERSDRSLDTAPGLSTMQRQNESQPESFAATPEQAQEAPETAAMLDVIPQVAEARTYFEERWQPPAGLETDLQYSIVIGADGSIQRVEPLGQASATYLDRTAIPLAGEPFVSAPSEGTPRIRLVLRPNGDVQTFLETPR